MKHRCIIRLAHVHVCVLATFHWSAFPCRWSTFGGTVRLQQKQGKSRTSTSLSHLLASPFSFSLVVTLWLLLPICQTPLFTYMCLCDFPHSFTHLFSRAQLVVVTLTVSRPLVLGALVMWCLSNTKLIRHTTQWRYWRSQRLWNWIRWNTHWMRREWYHLSPSPSWLNWIIILRCGWKVDKTYREDEREGRDVDKMEVERKKPEEDNMHTNTGRFSMQYTVDIVYFHAG